MLSIVNTATGDSHSMMIYVVRLFRELTVLGLRCLSRSIIDFTHTHRRVLKSYNCWLSFVLRDLGISIRHEFLFDTLTLRGVNLGVLLLGRPL